MSRLTEMLQREQELLWSDLTIQLRMAANEHWSLGVEQKLKRIMWIAEEVGISPWEKVSSPLLTSGIYAAVCKKLGVTVPDVPFDRLKVVHPQMWEKTVEYIDLLWDWEMF